MSITRLRENLAAKVRNWPKSLERSRKSSVLVEPSTTARVQVSSQVDRDALLTGEKVGCTRAAGPSKATRGSMATSVLPASWLNSEEPVHKSNRTSRIHDSTESPVRNPTSGKQRSLQILSLTLLVVSVFACDRTVTSPLSASIAAASVRNKALLAQTGHIPMLDELLEAVNAQAPGFGGMYRSGKSEMTIFVTPKGNNADVEKAARAVFVDYPWATIATVRFLPARFEVLELQAWRLRVPELGRAHLLSTDFDETANVVRVGLDPSADLAAATVSVVAIGAPAGAIVFHHETMRKPTQLLDSTHRPLVGGIKIGLTDTAISNQYGVHSYGECSLGFSGTLTNDAYDTYFVTAAHCAGLANAWAYQAVNAFQPDSFTNSSRIGYLWGMPTGSTTISGCPTGATCKYSDAALYIYVSGNVDLDFLARDSSFSSVSTVKGSRFRVDSFQVNGNVPEADLLAANTTAGQYDTYFL